MGCSCSAPKVGHIQEPSRKGLKSLQSLSCGLRLSAKKLKRSGRKSVDVGNAESVLTVPEVLKIAKEVVNEDFVGVVSPKVLAAIALIESGGAVDAMKWEEHLGESRHGLCQMLFSTAGFLFFLGHKRYSVSKPKSLHIPRVALYFGAAYLEHLSNLNCEKQDEEYIIRCYFGSPNDSCEDSTDDAWDKYVRARKQLEILEEAMCQEEEEIDEPKIHVLQEGETLSQISRICGTTVQAILEANPDIKDADLIQSGDCIELPVKYLLPRLYAVRPGDSMASIARKHDVSLFRLLKANPEIKNQNQVKLGWVLSIPGLIGSAYDNHGLVFGRGGLISAGIDNGSFFFNAMAERYGLAIDDGFWRGGEGLGILSREDLRGRLQAPRCVPSLRIPGTKV